MARHFADHCRSPSEAFDVVDIPFERKVQMLTALRVKVPAHSQGGLKMQTNLGDYIDTSPEIRSLVSTRTGTDLVHFKGDLMLEFPLAHK